MDNMNMDISPTATSPEHHEFKDDAFLYRYPNEKLGVASSSITSTPKYGTKSHSSSKRVIAPLEIVRGNPVVNKILPRSNGQSKSKTQPLTSSPMRAKNTNTDDSSSSSSRTKKQQNMVSSIKGALNSKLNEYDAGIIKSSSRQHAIAPIPPTYSSSSSRYHETYEGFVQLEKHINNVWNRKNKNIISSTILRTQKRRNARKQVYSAIRNLWKKRNARSIEEGIRREKNISGLNDKFMSNNSNSRVNSRHSSSGTVENEQNLSNREQLSLLLEEGNLAKLVNEHGKDDEQGKNKRKKRYVARTISGLISALAEEATGVDVNLHLRDDTPLWHKHVDKFSIQFERLGVKQLKMGGLDEELHEVNLNNNNDSDDESLDTLDDDLMIMIDNNNSKNSTLACATPDDIFDQIDVDNSGALCAEELTRALTIASGVVSPSDRSLTALGILAKRLIGLYDINGDGVVDREEYKKLTEDMTVVRDAKRQQQKERELRRTKRLAKRKGRFNPIRWGKVTRRAVFRLNHRNDDKSSTLPINGEMVEKLKVGEMWSSAAGTQNSSSQEEENGISFETVQDISDDPEVLNAMKKVVGSIVLEDLELDLRRLVFGALPLVKKITPGGPLILEPFSMTITASFNREDFLESVLLDDGLRRLVARALRRRVRSIRDLLDGAVFYGRTWNTASKQAPVVEVPKLTNVEFDNKNRLIITGKARVRTSPDQPFVENSFKLRTKLGTRENGQYIRLEEPELALILECPKTFEKNIVALCKTFNLPIPTKPEPIDQFFPLVSPIKKTEADGFNLGDDNRIKSIFVKDDALRFEISAVLRPGRFLGNHYLAFTIPNRTFIITMDRIREGIRNARENKRKLRELEQIGEQEAKKHTTARYNKAVAQALSKSNDFGEDEDLSFSKEFNNDNEQYLFREAPKSEVEVVDEEVLPNRPGFFGRFLEGYLESAREETEKETDEQLTTAISEFFSSDEDSKVLTVIDSDGKKKQRAIV